MHSHDGIVPTYRSTGPDPTGTLSRIYSDTRAHHDPAQDLDVFAETLGVAMTVHLHSPTMTPGDGDRLIISQCARLAATQVPPSDWPAYPVQITSYLAAVSFLQPPDCPWSVPFRS